MDQASFDSSTFAAPAYRSANEHLTDLLLRHDGLLKRLIARGRSRPPADLLGFAAISESEVQRLLDASSPTEQSPDLPAIEHTLEQLQQHIDARVERSRHEGVRLPLIELAERLALSPREVDLLFAALVVEIDSRYERVHGFLHDDMSRRLVSTGVALSLYCANIDEQLSTRALLAPQAPLRYYRLLELPAENAAMSWMSRPMKVDERIVAYLLGDPLRDHRIAGYLTTLDAPDWAETDRALVQWLLDRPPASKPFIYLHGQRGAGADALVSSVAAQACRSVLPIDVASMLEIGTDFENALFLIFREALLSQAAIYLRNVDRAFEQPQGAARYRTLMRCVAELGSVVFASGEQRWSWPLPEAPVIVRLHELHPEGFEHQLHAWRTLSRGELTESQLHRLVSLYPLPVAAIRDVWRLAHGGRSQPTFEQLKQACRAHSGPAVSSLARRIEPRHQWSDLVLPPAQMEQLTAMCSQARHASLVYGAWQFERKLSLGMGLNALFCGPPGTGKTLAAEAIAAELGVDLLKIDLSQIASKYIGETEKNLRQLFDEAARANAILFFDEADALLGKRSDVKDAHDRYANTQTAYLLQKMEEYPGITILASNLRQNMDAAFTRRMRFIVDFPFPEEEDRLRIWRAVWPEAVPLATDLDLALLARQFRLSGGSIRNVALSAAFLAAEEGQSVSMQHLMRATKRELHKMGRLVSDEPAPARRIGGA